ncbi:MAG: winged helix-turn-helix transcriptional regulator [Chthoniobacterales bacterium]|nr:winged helix-turn-helix transcriptional regulator [Chthoniobacterales bacterium]
MKKPFATTYEHPPLAGIPFPQVMAALSDPCRVRIVSALLDSNRELACGEFGLPHSKATISHHFRILREAGIIETRVEGNRCLSRVRTADLEKYFPGLLALVAASPGESLKWDPTHAETRSARRQEP